MCSYDIFKFMWSKGWICTWSYYHQIKSINLSHCYRIFPGCVWNICAMVKVAFVRLHNALSHYHHYAEVRIISPCLVRSWNNGIHCMSSYVLVTNEWELHKHIWNWRLNIQQTGISFFEIIFQNDKSQSKNPAYVIQQHWYTCAWERNSGPCLINVILLFTAQ